MPIEKTSQVFSREHFIIGKYLLFSKNILDHGIVVINLIREFLFHHFDQLFAFLFRHHGVDAYEAGGFLGDRVHVESATRSHIYELAVLRHKPVAGLAFQIMLDVHCRKKTIIITNEQGTHHAHNS